MKFNSYFKCIEYLYSLERAGIKYDLNNIKTLSKACGNPHKDFKSIHIAGTNGKGAVASLISSVLTESRYKTGLYTSPHIKDFRERIRVNGKVIPKDYVIRFTEKYYGLLEKIKPSFFETTTAMAFKYFADCKVDFAVIECGLGGRLDSTNIIKPKISVITSISIDHSEYLGKTIKSITNEKAEIVKRNVPCVTGNVSNYSKSIIKSICKQKKSVIVDSSDFNIDYKITDTGFDVYLEEYGKYFSLPLGGKYQINNLGTALAVLNNLKDRKVIDFSGYELEKGFRNINQNTGYGYRFQIVSEKPKIILDVSHNADGISNLKENTDALKYEKLFIVFGMMADKELGKCINELEKLKGIIILTKPDYKRACNPEDFAKHISGKSKYIIKENVKDAFNHARSLANKNDIILITGSFFMVSDFLKHFKKYDKSNNI
ncbi:MAG: folylpolyglutamate synthase/dihydrofolate synthase family protein [Candidatus Kapaibacterium sp.]